MAPFGSSPGGSHPPGQIWPGWAPTNLRRGAEAEASQVGWPAAPERQPPGKAGGLRWWGGGYRESASGDEPFLPFCIRFLGN